MLAVGRIRRRSILSYKVRGAAPGPADASRPNIVRQKHAAQPRLLAQSRQSLLRRSDRGARSKGDCEEKAAADAWPTDYRNVSHSKPPSAPWLRLLDREHCAYLIYTRCSFSFHPQNAQLALAGCEFYGKRQRSIRHVLSTTLLCLVFPGERSCTIRF